ncbi:hypothetical protein VTN49DRAFT_2936 [Thermomyces lanuginosus]|uniref:uncharacterized protein n=1 Tax=Thermomyces lanuginosus TaxID=5541 RepID=UPI003742D7F5
MSLSFSKPAAPAKVPTDTVLPFRYFDGQKIKKLRGAFARLLEMDGWKTLGARLRMNSKGKLEYHLPAMFTEDRPSFIYSFEHFGSSIAEHPIGSRLPRGGNKPMIFGGADKYSALLGDPRIPLSYKDWINLDIPQLGLRIVTFNDATCVTITFLHSLTDAVGFLAILRGWIAILHGKEDEVPPFVGLENDPLLLAVKKPPPRWVLADKVLRGFPLLVYGVRTMFQSHWYKNDVRKIFLPAKKMEQMYQDALEELAKQNPDPGEVPFISENDVFSAWWAKLLMRVQRPAADRTINVMNAFDCRGVLTEMGLIPSPDVGLITNAVNGIWTVLSARQVLEEPLGSLALQIRRSLEQQRTVEQVRASLAEAKDANDRTGYSYIVGDSGMMLVIISSWQKAKFFTFDFSPAVIKVGTPLGKRDNQLGCASYICVRGATGGGMTVVNGGAVTGKDEKGNIWFNFRLRSDLWASVEEQLRKM